MNSRSLLPLVSTVGLLLASCGHAATGEKPPAAAAPPFTVTRLAGFDEPWAMAIDAASGIALVTERKGQLRLLMPDGRTATVGGTPVVAYGGQGGLGDVIFAPGDSGHPPGGGSGLDGRVIYLSWAEAGPGDTRGAAVGMGTLACDAPASCRLDGLKVIWRQVPKVTGQGHYSHRLAFSPDGTHLFVSSGERQKFTPAQDPGSNLGKIVRLLPDGTPAPGNPWQGRPAPRGEIWSYGHRNVLGLAFDAQGRLWDLEHGPAGGDELNLVKPGQNYGWPLVSDGDHYDGRPIPRHATRPDLAAPAISWNPVIAPGDFIFYSGTRFAGWNGQALIASFALPGLVRVRIDGEKAVEEARYPLENRIREIEQAPDGSLLLLEDGPAPGSGHLLRLTPPGAN